MTPKQLRDAPHWKFFRRGQLWYDRAAGFARRITYVWPGAVRAKDDRGLVFTWYWGTLDDEVIRTWALLT